MIHIICMFTIHQDIHPCDWYSDALSRRYINDEKQTLNEVKSSLYIGSSYDRPVRPWRRYHELKYRRYINAQMPTLRDWQTETTAETVVDGKEQGCLSLPVVISGLIAEFILPPLLHSRVRDSGRRRLDRWRLRIIRRSVRRLVRVTKHPPTPDPR